MKCVLSWWEGEGYQEIASWHFRERRCQVPHSLLAIAGKWVLVFGYLQTLSWLCSNAKCCTDPGVSLGIKGQKIQSCSSNVYMVCRAAPASVASFGRIEAEGKLEASTSMLVCWFVLFYCRRLRATPEVRAAAGCDLQKCVTGGLPPKTSWIFGVCKHWCQVSRKVNLWQKTCRMRRFLALQCISLVTVEISNSVCCSSLFSYGGSRLFRGMLASLQSINHYHLTSKICGGSAGTVIRKQLPKSSQPFRYPEELFNFSCLRNVYKIRKEKKREKLREVFCHGLQEWPWL